MNRKRLVSLLLAMVLALATVSVICASSVGEHEWDAGWNPNIASASGWALCDAYGAEAEVRCFTSSGIVVSTNAYVEAIYQYRMSDSCTYYVEEAYSEDSTIADVSFSCDFGEESMFIEYYYSVSYTTLGATQDEVYSGSEIVFSAN